MKKNLLSVIILALLVVNIVLTSIMMVSVMGTMKKSSKLIDGISSALALEVNEPQVQKKRVQLQWRILLYTR